MTSYTKFICGLSLDANTILRVSADAPDTRAQLFVTRRDDPDRVAYQFNANEDAWVASLGAADYVVAFEVDIDHWFDGAMTATTDSLQTFVYHGPSDPPAAHVTTAWKATVAVAGEDPKDPWPPPGTAVAFDPWFESALHDARDMVVMPKGIGGRSPAKQVG